MEVLNENATDVWTCLLLNVKSGESSILLQELHDAAVTITTSGLEGRLLSLVVDDPGQGVISSCCQKLTHHLHVTLIARYEERSSSIFLGLIDVSPSSQQLTHHLHVTLLARTVERSVAIFHG